MIHKVFNHMSTLKINLPNKNLESTIKDLNAAIEGWEKITSKTPNEQDFSQEGLQKQTKELLIKLREQLNDLSKD